MQFRFELIDPTDPFGGAGRHGVLGEAVYWAAMKFAAKRSANGLEWERPPLSDISECATETFAQIAEHWVRTSDDDESDRQGENSELTHEILSAGATFIDLLTDRDDRELGPLSFTLASGRICGEAQMFASLVLMQCERAAQAIGKQAADQVATLMWDIHELISELDHTDVRAEALATAMGAETVAAEAVAANARYAAHARHAETRAMRSDVWRWCDAEMSRYPSMDAAAEAAAGKIVPMTFRTVRAWIKSWPGLAEWREQKRRSARKP